MKNLAILGSTGSIGKQTLELVREHPDEFRVVALSCNNNIELLKKQIEEFNPELVAVFNKEKAELLVDSEPGMQGLKKIASLESATTVINSLVGSIGVLPTIEAIRNNKDVALANKETLVTAGDIVMKEVKKHNINLMPIDSEHSAIFQCLNGENHKEVNKITLTCSGGAFKDYTLDRLKTAKASDALKHPTWNMGSKITIDSATLMNKGFEVIEAHHLYNTPYDDIEVVIHPESIIHSFVEFHDHSTIAQLGIPSMKIPIQYALTYPKRFKNSALPRLDIAKTQNLTFKEPNMDLFPCLKYAYIAGYHGGTLPAVMNAANEIAVKYFLENKISLLDIAKTIKQAMDNHKIIKEPGLEEIIDIDKKIKEETENKLK